MNSLFTRLRNAMTRDEDGNRMEALRWFFATLAVIALLDAGFIWLNYGFISRNVIRKSIRTESVFAAGTVVTAFRSASHTQESAASFLAQSRGFSEIMYQGALALRASDDPKGMLQSVRSQILTFFLPVWGKHRRASMEKQLKIYVHAPGGHFVRLDTLDAPGIPLTPPSKIALDAARTGHSTSGVIIDSDFAGFRAAAPVYSPHPDNGQAELIGIVELERPISETLQELKDNLAEGLPGTAMSFDFAILRPGPDGTFSDIVTDTSREGLFYWPMMAANITRGFRSLPLRAAIEEEDRTHFLFATAVLDEKGVDLENAAPPDGILVVWTPMNELELALKVALFKSVGWGIFGFMIASYAVYLLWKTGSTHLRALVDERTRELAKAIRGLAEAEQRYRGMYENAVQGMFQSTDTRFLSVNPAMARILGYDSPEELLALENIREEIYFDPDDMEEWAFPLLEMGVIRDFEVRLKRKDGKPVWLLMSLRHHTAKDGEHIYEGIAVDNTDRHQAEALREQIEAKEAEQKLLRADKMAALGRVMAGVAHEINNPNNFISFNLPVLRDYLEEVREVLERLAETDPGFRIGNQPWDSFMEDVVQLVGDMEYGTKRINTIVSLLRHYIRGHEEAEKSLTDVRTLTDNVVTLVGKQMEKMVRNFGTDIPEDLPPVMIHAGKIEQVLINLLINAAQAADKDDSFVRLSAAVPPESPDTLAIRVEDNGSGIPEEVREQIFDPFFTTKDTDQGSGLGLSIAQRILEEHGGKIAVESVPGEGTAFTVTLPLGEKKQP